MELTSENKSGLLRAAKLAGAGFAGFLLLVWLAVAYVGLRVNKARLQKLEPMLSEARALGADFDAAVADPGKYKDKHASWCVQNIGGGRVFYRGDLNRGLRVFNYEQMPLSPGYKHKNCEDMLLQLKDSRKLSTGGSVVDVVYVAPLDQI
jgi:hypothetical protein